MNDDLRTANDRAYAKLMAQLRTPPTPNSEAGAEANKEAKDPPATCDESDAFEEMYMEWLEQWERRGTGG
jgi:hypothetical protein